jgi:hypothetical protein
MTEYKCECGAVFRVDSADDIGTIFCTCPSCGAKKTLDKEEQERRDTLAEWLKEHFGELKREATLSEVLDILGETIKFDNDIKLIVFLAMLTAFTSKEQVNIIMEGESSVGKTYTIHEIILFFPESCWLKKNGVTPTSFFYDDQRVLMDKNTLQKVELVRPSKDASDIEKQEYKEKRDNCVMLQDFERKIIWLPDMPDVKVMEKLRSLLSHDDKVCNYTSTMTNQHVGLQAKTTLLKGFGVFIICCCTPMLDEQETSRAFQLNPGWSKEKEAACLDLISRREASPEFNKLLEDNPKRSWLRNRIEMIASAKVNEVFVGEELSLKVLDWFNEKRKVSTPKSSREFTRFRSLMKAWALFNLWTRKQDEDKNLYCEEKDFDVAKLVYESIVEASAFNLCLEEYTFYKALEAEYPYRELSEGFRVSNAHTLFYDKNGRACSDKRLRNMLESFCREGLLRKEKQGQTYYYHIQSLDHNENIHVGVGESSGWINNCEERA